MNKILIFYASYGNGHLSAATSIESVINEKYPNIETKVIDCMKYINKPIEKVTTSAYRYMAKKGLWGKMYNASQKGFMAHVSQRANIIMSHKMNKLIELEKPDMVISAHPFSSQMCAHLKKKGKNNLPLATIMTDFAPHDQWLVGHEYTDFYFVAHDKMKQYLISKGIDENKIYALGIPINPKFTLNYNKDDILKEFNLPNNKKIVLFFGGWNAGNAQVRTLEIFKSIAKFSDSIHVIAISAKNEKLKNGFEYNINENNLQNVTVIDYTKKIAELMSIASLVVAKPGGLTTSESMAMNVPMILINPIAGQEEENAEFLESKGVGIWIKKDDNIEKKINNLLSDDNKLLEIKNNTNILAHKFATYEIVKVLLG